MSCWEPEGAGPAVITSLSVPAGQLTRVTVIYSAP